MPSDFRLRSWLCVRGVAGGTAASDPHCVLCGCAQEPSDPSAEAEAASALASAAWDDDGAVRAPPGPAAKRGRKVGALQSADFDDWEARTSLLSSLFSPSPRAPWSLFIRVA